MRPEEFYPGAVATGALVRTTHCGRRRDPRIRIEAAFKRLERFIFAARRELGTFAKYPD